MSEITDGFWELIGKQGTCIWSGNRIVASMAEARTNHKRARREAKLIAAAPQLYTALKDLERLVAENDVENKQWAFNMGIAVMNAREALAKATA